MASQPRGLSWFLKSLLLTSNVLGNCSHFDPRSVAEAVCWAAGFSCSDGSAVIVKEDIE